MLQTLVALFFLLAACGPSEETPDNRTPCTSQLDCDLERLRVCEAGYCSAPLPRNSTEGADGRQLYFRDLNIDVTKLKPKVPRALRAFVIYPVTPAGPNVTCADIPSAEALKDPTAFNLTVSPVEQNISSPGDVIRTAVHVNGVGRLLHVTMYDSVLYDNPEVIGVGCLESGEIAEAGIIGMTMKRP